MPNAGLPQLTADGAHYPLKPVELADALEQFVSEFGLGLVGGCCGTGPEHLRRVVERLERPGAGAAYADARRRPPRRCTPRCRSGRTPATCRSGSGPTPTARRPSGRRCWRSAGTTASTSPGPRSATAPTCSTSTSTTSVGTARPTCGRSPSRFATASTLPLVLDSTEPAVLQAGLEALGGRAVINSVNYEDGDGPDSRFAKITKLVVEHGAAVIALTIDEEGQARTADWKVAVAERLITDLTDNWGMQTSDIIIDCLTFPIATGQEETRRDGIETIEAIREVKRRFPEVQTTLGPVQHLLRPQPGRSRGAQLGVPERVHRGRAGLGDRARGQDRADGPDPGRAARGGAGHGVRPAPGGLRPAAAVPGAVRGGHHRRHQGRAGGGAGQAAGERAAAAADRRRRGQGPRRRPRPGAGRQAGPGDHQHRPAGRDEGRGRAVRLGPDAAAVRAAVGRGDEVGGGLPGAAPGEGRLPRQGHHRAGHGQGRRARHRQEPGRHHPDQQRLHRGQPGHQAADRHASSRRPRSTRRTPSGCPGCWSSRRW